jgi:SAM-dependent methyltransferase
MTDQAPKPAEPTLEATLARLKLERDEADARYNRALTALDQALVRPVDLPRPAPPFDDHQVAPLNDGWNTLPAPPAEPSGLRGKLTRFVWRIVQPYFERQLAFNSRVVDHINRNMAARQASHRSVEALVDALGAHLNAMASFHALQMLYLQEVTGYVDTRDRDVGGRTLVLNAALGGLADGTAKRWESLGARDRRVETRMAALERAHDELRSIASVAQQAVLTLKREMERAAAPAPATPAAAGPAASGAEAAPARDAFAPSLDAYKYVGFEDRFRGSRAVIRERLESYLPLFTGTRPGGDVLDVGCGRGEFLDLLRERGVPARGLDLNHEMAEACRARGLDVAEADAVGYLSAVPDGSLAGIFSAQVVEHLEPGYLLRFLELACLKLQPGGRLVLETLNPACWVAFFESYIRDITHVWPLHPDTLSYLATASGFTRVRVEFRSPVPAQDRLQPVAVRDSADAASRDMADVLNANVEKLNARMFTYMDYAVIAER